MMQFELPQDEGSIIKVIGVGGGGSNAVNHMYRQGIKGVDFIVCNTDKQALDKSPVPHKIQLGFTLTKGLGAGSIPEIGREAALDTIEDIKKHLDSNTQMVFITAGLGGGTGTGAAPVIASIARELGILTVGIVTIPFSFEGKKRRLQAEQGLEEMKKYVDTLLVIGNDKLREIYGNLKMSEAFAHADNVLSNAAKSIAEIISLHMHVNVDFNDVKTVMKDSGVAVMGSAVASGEKRSIHAVESALNSPLLNDNDIRGARHVLLNIMSGNEDIDMDEFGEITDFIQEASGGSAELITGYGTDASLGDNVSVTIIATGFKSKMNTGYEPPVFVERKVMNLDEQTPKADNPTKKAEPLKEEKAPEPFVFKKAISEEQPEKKEETEKKAESKQISLTDSNEFNFTINEVKDEHRNNVILTETPVTEEPSTQEFVINSVSSDESVVDESSEKEVLSREEQIRLAQERIKKLKELTLKMKTPEGLAQLEKESAWARKNIQLENKMPSSESQVSRYTLSESDDKKIEIRPNNSFLHDNVD